MAINLKKAKLPFKGISTSWTDFYFNMALEMAEQVAVSKGSRVIANSIGGDVNQTAALVDAIAFAQALAEEYDKVIRGGGRSIIGGVPVQSGNKVLMAIVAASIIRKTTFSKTGDLLRDIGPAVQAYWVGATLKAPTPTPNFPCIGALKNLSTTLAINLSPGIWTPIVVPPVDNVSPFLLNFILSASLHLLTVGGIFTCLCEYPPPAPPAPGILPWVGYSVNPFGGNPISSFDFKDIVGFGVGSAIAPFITNEGEITTQNVDVSAFATQLSKGFVEGEGFQEPQIREAFSSILGGQSGTVARND